ncbi:VOC family protein [Nakamurella endophytica]|uniref:Glyoxalase n=1 Tax=Nakamurella endophytica TaxID=1748367 RepID=A0A917SRB5_9ACTN|nr:VOC family protein [Nakamurella endophytica]GGL91016.1 glyoxalase [Nakamurella endophytica]
MTETVSLQVVVDAGSPALLAGFWSVALGYRLDDPPPGFQTWEEALRASGLPEERWDDASAIVPLHGPGPRIFFQKVPEHKQVKNRLHLDVGVGRGISDPQQRWERVMQHVERLIGAGAAVVQERTGDWGERWMVMTDPEGNEFCVQ